MHAHVLLPKCFPGLFLMSILSPTVIANTEKFGTATSLPSCCVFGICQLRCSSSYNQWWCFISTLIIIQLTLLDKSLTYVYMFVIYCSFRSYKWDYMLTKSCWNKYNGRTSAWISKLLVSQLRLWQCGKRWDQYKNNRLSECLRLGSRLKHRLILYSWGVVWACFLLHASEHNSLCD